MFGYVRPLKSELKIREYDQYKAMYCGLCHCLGRNYGWISRFLLNYDYTFLALILSAAHDSGGYEASRCMVSPFKKKTHCSVTPAINTASGCSVILTWWKLDDEIRDRSFWRSLTYRLIRLMLRRSYRKSVRQFPLFAKSVEEGLFRLHGLELDKKESIDMPADAFARILEAAGVQVQDDGMRRTLQLLLYHTGRWIYIMDAIDDIGEDLQSGNYNPLILRYHIESPELPDDIKHQISLTATHSCNLAISAFELTDFHEFTDVIGNILYCGMPFVQEQVLAGTWKQRRKKDDRSL